MVKACGSKFFLCFFVVSPRIAKRNTRLDNAKISSVWNGSMVCNKHAQMCRNRGFSATASTVIAFKEAHQVEVHFASVGRLMALNNLLDRCQIDRDKMRECLIHLDSESVFERLAERC